MPADDLQKISLRVKFFYIICTGIRDKDKTVLVFDQGSGIQRFLKFSLEIILILSKLKVKQNNSRSMSIRNIRNNKRNI